MPYRGRTRFYTADHKVRVLAFPEWPITNEWGLTLAYTLRTLLDAEECVEVTVVQLRQWPKTVNRAMIDLMQHHACRVDVLRCPTWHTMLNTYQTHDWMLYLPEKINIGVRLAEAYSQGLPVVALDLPPTGEYVKHEKSAILIPCEAIKDVLGRPTARLNTHEVIEAVVHKAVGDRPNWFNLVADREEEWKQRKEYFETVWSSVLSPF